MSGDAWSFSKRMRLKRLLLCGAVAAGILLGGCSSGLPRIRPDLFEKRFPAVPEGVAPVFSWNGERTGLFTYWHRQDIRVSARAWFPPGLREIEDARWQVDARNGEGKYVPFLGLVKTWTNEHGTRLTVVAPSVEMDALPDGLYIALKPDLTIEEGKVTRVMLLATLHEIRGHVFKPFCVKIPMVPEKPSALTPTPPPLPKKPAGTPIPFD